MAVRPSFFSAPTKGRRVCAGFAYLQRIGKGAQTRLWLSNEMAPSCVEWAAVREFELMQDADNLAIDDLDATDMSRSLRAFMKMRGGGLRLTTLFLGQYSHRLDDLKILDEKLQDEITQMTHFLYLDKPSAAASALHDERLENGSWRCTEALPHVARALGERRLFNPNKGRPEESLFVHLMERLPARHIVHDIAIGLALPDATKEKNCVYLPLGEHRALAFFNAIGAALGELFAVHMRGYGFRLTPQAATWQRRAALMFCPYQPL